MGLWTALAMFAIGVLRADAYGCRRQRGTCACQTDVAGGFELDLSRLAGPQQPRFRAPGWERVCALPLLLSLRCSVQLPLPVQRQVNRNYYVLVYENYLYYVKLRILRRAVRAAIVGVQPVHTFRMLRVLPRLLCRRLP